MTERIDPTERAYDLSLDRYDNLHAWLLEHARRSYTSGNSIPHRSTNRDRQALLDTFSLIISKDDQALAALQLALQAEMKSLSNAQLGIFDTHTPETD